MAPTNKVREDLAKRFLEALQRQELPWQSGWRSARPINPVSGTKYKGVNRLYLSCIAQEKGYPDPRWCTFKQAQDKGWRIRKGERGTLVEYWAYYDTQSKRLLKWSAVRELLRLDPDYQQYLQLRCRTSVVFNAAQIDGIPERVAPHLDIGALRGKRDTLVHNMGVCFREGGDYAYYTLKKDTITLPLEANFLDSCSYMSTLLHEAGHATGHASRLNRDLSGDFGSESYAREELRAEIASAFTAQELGLELTDGTMDKHIENHVAYIQGWIAVLEKDPGELFKAINDAQGISDYLLEKGEFLSDEMEREKSDTPLDKALRLGNTEADIQRAAEHTGGSRTAVLDGWEQADQEQPSLPDTVQEDPGWEP